MGIEQFYSTIYHNPIINPKKNPSIIDWKQKLKAKHFFLDFNSLIHNGSSIMLGQLNTFLDQSLQTKNIGEFNQIKNRLEKKNHLELDIKIRKFKQENIAQEINQYFTHEKLNHIMVEDTIHRIYLILDKYVDTSELETFYIAFDGVPSKGKLIEQKKRSYIKTLIDYFNKQIFAKHQKELKKDMTANGSNRYVYEKNKIRWHKLNIKPGTEFMKLLSKRLRSKNFLKKLKKKLKHLKTYILSDVYHYGEGENKFMDYIRKHLFPDDRYLILGPDSDLILLTMLLKSDKIKILRYNQQKVLFNVIDIAKVKSNLFNFIHAQYPNSNYKRVIPDLVFIFNIFGNDFLPKVESYQIKYTLNKVIMTYIEILKKTNQFLLKFDQKYNINFFFFYKLIDRLSDDEYNIFYQNSKRSRPREIDKNLSEYDQELLRFDFMMEEYQTKLNRTNFFSLGKKAGLTKYYQKYYRNLDQIIHSYLEGLIWVLDYYFHVFHGISWWYYPHEKAPLLTDIRKYLKKIKDPKRFFNQLSEQTKEKYKVNLETYFVPEEQIIYLMTADNPVNMIAPIEFRKYADKHNINLNSIVQKIWEKDKNNLIDCANVPYLNKCVLNVTKKETDDLEYLKRLRQDFEFERKKGYYVFRY